MKENKRKYENIKNEINKKQHKQHSSSNSNSSSRTIHSSSSNSSSKITTNSILIDKTLPIFNYKEELLLSISSNQTTIIIGETGSGKSTQLPQFLSELYSTTCILCTQPRRVAAVTIAERVSKERNCILGNEVGYSIRFDDCSGPLTKIKYVTDGVLLREIMTDPNLEKYNVVILDEAHERSLQTDILMGLLKQLQQRKPSLRIVVMSATLEAEIFANYFQNANMITISGRQHPVEIMYTLKPEPDIIEATFLTCLQVHEEEEDGGILVFLPGQDDIESVHQLLEQHLPTIIPQALPPINQELQTNEGNESEPSSFSDPQLPYRIFPLYAALSSDEQLLAFQPSIPGIRKIVLATNIAETSVTISGIKYVIDPGKMKTRCIHPFTGADMLQVMPVSQAQAQQRAGRAGRECPGKCFRLYTEDSFNELQVTSLPEIQRVGIAQVMLQLMAIGVSNPITFPYISPPSKTALMKGLSQLIYLGALSKDKTLTEHGRKMARIPLEPTYAHLLLSSQEFGCVSEALTAVSMLSTDNIYIQPHREEEKQIAGQIHKQFSSKDGDFITLINIYDSWVKSKKSKQWALRSYINYRALLHADSIRQQLQQLLNQLNVNTSLSCLPERDPILKCIAKGLCTNIASLVTSIDQQQQQQQQQNKSSLIFNNKFNQSNSNRFSGPTCYRTVMGSQDVYVHPTSSLFSVNSKQKIYKYLVYAEILVTSKHYMRCVSILDQNWIQELNIPFIRSNVSEAVSKNTNEVESKHSIINKKKV